MKTITRSVLAASCFLGFWTPSAWLSAAPAAAQVDSKGNQSPHVDCTVCGERSYTFPSGAPVDKDGNLVTWCMHCKKDTPHTSSVNQSPGIGPAPEKSNARGGLRLRRPAGESVAKSEDGAEESAKPSAAPPQTPAPLDTQRPVQPSPAANFVFQEVRKLKSLEDRLIAPAVDSLCAMGEPGLAAARNELSAMEPPVILVAARALLRSPTPADVDLVQKRLREKMPAAGSAAILTALVSADPVRAGPRFLVEMLDSQNGNLRVQAARELRPLLAQAGMDVLQPAFASKRADTRLEAVSLAGSLSDSAATQTLLDHLADSAPNVAAQVISELAGRKDDALDQQLLSLAFSGRWLLRSQAYALLAIVEREDVGTRGILEDTQIQPLLAAMDSNDPFVSGASACALAGIGFRSVQVREANWLDQGVVDRLVGVVSGKVFHNDFSSLQGPALRRLRLLTGQDAGTDGARWVDWWIAARPGFHALRAWIPFEDAELDKLSMRILDGKRTWRLMGPAIPWPVDLTAGEDAFILSIAQAQDLARVLQAEGVFGPERLPGTRGTRGAGERSAQIAVAGRGKAFILGADATEPWFDRCIAAARSLAETNRWELYPIPGRHVNAGELWVEQSAWWSAEHTPLERESKLKELVLATLAARTSPMRARAFTELEHLYSMPDLVSPSDFSLFLGALGGDAPPVAVPSLIRMALMSARSASPQVQQIPVEPARELVRAVVSRPDSIPSALPSVLEAAGPAFTREMLSDPLPAVRAAAARVMPRFPDSDPVALLLPLLSDKVTEVQVACIDALGELRAENMRTELLVRARLGVKPVRIAALRAVGKLRGEYVLDALLLALSEGDPELRLAAVDGMAELEDPASAPFLISLLSDTTNPALHDAAHAGLLRLRERAWPELRRALIGAAPTGKLESALVLSEQCAPEAVPALLGALTANPRDARVGNELAILTCVDFRGQEDPASHWWDWWDGVVHEDSIAWLRACLERLQLNPPAAEALADKGTRDGQTYLLRLCVRPEAWLAERARRQLARMLGTSIDPIPPAGQAREDWMSRLSAEIEKHREP
ncbi:MAG: HEAT repeat domain-containing protein [Planctomycetes bacterium]|nr:HEAT repeat domain-containing protein [Planctomycetota bacterium]